MKLFFFKNKKLPSNKLHISKCGTIRFKQNMANQFGIEQGQRWNVGWDESEEIPSAIYLVKSKDNLDGYKILYLNLAHRINISGALKKLGINTPMKCEYGAFNNNEYEGIKITIKIN